MYNPLSWLTHNRTSLALLVSVFTLGWNVYRDVIAKPRLGVSLRPDRDVHSGESGKTVYQMTLSIVNYGPGKVRCECAVLRIKPAWWKLLRQRTWEMLLHGEGGYYSGEMPFFIEVADRQELVFPESVLGKNPHQIGVRDSYGRNHWAPKHDLCKVRKRIQEHRAKQLKPESPKSSPGGQDET